MQPAQGELGALSAIESILLVAGGPVELSRLAQATGCSKSQLVDLLDRVAARMPAGIRLQRHGEEAQLVTAPENIEYVHAFLGSTRPPPLSRAALETLTVIAYRQPVTRPEIEDVRGVNSDRAVHTLLARGLIEELGPRAGLGRPMEYGTAFGFLEYFGLESLDELPPVPASASAEEEPDPELGFR